jgi:hypothetical protein
MTAALAVGAQAQVPAPAPAPVSEERPAGAAPAATASLEPPMVERRTADFSVTRGQYYKRTWGVEIIGVQPMSSGYMLALRYRITDPVKARQLNDRAARAYLVDEATGTWLAVPSMENIGELRPGAKPEADRNYFMIFGNPAKLVKRGNRVSLVVGTLRVDGLVVQ